MTSLHWVILLILATIMSTVNGQGLGEILNGPQTQIVVPGSTAYFNCHARGNNVYWHINNSNPHPRSTYEAKGFAFSDVEIPRPRGELEEHNNTILVEARPSNNSTRIACTAEGWYSNQRDFQDGTLIIAGPPLAPVIEFTHDNLINSYILSRLSWSIPFTLPDFPVTNYTVTMFNHSNGETVTTIRTANYADYSHQLLSKGDNCYEIDFTIVAANRIGRSPPAIIHTGHPIVPGEIDEIVTVITFTGNVTPHLSMSFFAPRICPYSYQIGSYNITIYDVMNQTVVHLGPMEYTQTNLSQQILVTKQFMTGLIRDKCYTLEVVTESIGVVHMKRKSINTFIDGVCPEVTTTIDAFNATSTTQLLKETLSTASNHIMYSQGASAVVAAGVTIGAIACFITVIIIFIVVFITRRRRRNLDGEAVVYSKPRKSKKTKPSALTCTMASNPIYEGPLYEATPGEAIKSLISPCSTPSTPADLTPRYFDIPPSLPPPRNQSLDTQPKLEPVDEVDAIKPCFKDVEIPQCENEYMVMNGVKPGDGRKDILPSDGYASDVEKINSEQLYTMMK